MYETRIIVDNAYIFLPHQNILTITHTEYQGYPVFNTELNCLINKN